MADFTHFDKNGSARMVDVSKKDPTAREAVATASVTMQPKTLQLIVEGGVKKGDVLSVARLAGIMAAKRTPELVPLCHPLALNSVEVELTCNDKRSAVDIKATCRVFARTGVEMEALTAASVAALTIYDMCKAADKHMEIHGLRVIHKEGGKNDFQVV